MAYQIFQADIGDVEFMALEILNASAGQHFSGYILRDGKEKLVRRDLHSIITTGQRLNEALRAQPMVLEQHGVPVGFAIISEMFAGQGGHELYVFCIAKQHAGKGHGRYLLDYINRTWSRVDLYCRCAPSSNRMFEMLLHRGFEHIKSTDDGYRILRRNKNLLNFSMMSSSEQPGDTGYIPG